MRVLMISPYFPPLLSVGSLRAWSFAKGFADRGHCVHVLTTAKREDQRGLEVSDGRLTVHEIAVPKRLLLDHVRRSHAAPAGEHVPGEGGGGGILREVKERTGVFSSVRMPDMTDAWIGPATKAAEIAGPWDLVISSCGPYTAHLVALRLGSQRGRWIADYRDLWTTNHQFAGLYPFTLREKALERRVMAQADAATTVSEPLARRLHDAGARRVQVIYNGFFEHEPEEVDATGVFASDGRTRVVYTGTVYPKHQDVRPVLRAIAASPRLRECVRLVVAGQGMSHWLGEARRLGVEDVVEAMGLVSRPNALRLQRDADALLAIEYDGDYDGVLSGKIFEYLSASAPIVVTGPRGCVGDLVERVGRGSACVDDEALRRTLEGIVDGRGANQAARREHEIAFYTREKQADRLVDLGECLTGCQARAQAL
ncbi:MAG: glycosyltransferase [Phycisphaeraceae bacterium]|nr:glycosyltransferase [Phycisphaeraceae bacterium]MCW5763100.1 glycosyltransferase [Phycisphaeraceae bacterium]